MTVPAGAQLNTGGGGPPVPHPTVPFGQQVPQGGQPPVQLPYQQPPVQQPPVQQQPPAGFAGFDLNNPGGQPPVQQQPPAQQPPAYQPPAGFNPAAIIQAGPGVPPELVGRTMGQAFQIYQALATDYLGRTNPRQPAPQAQQPPVQQPPVQQGQPPAGAPEDRAFWTAPAKFIREAVQEVVTQTMAPVTQQNLENQVVAAREQARAAIPDFVQLWPDIVGQLRGIDPSALTDPNVWASAADMVRGRRGRPGQQQQPPQGGGYAGAGGMPSVPAGSPGAPMLPQFAFFSEGPTPQGNNGQSGVLTPDEAAAASKFGMTPQEYMAWKGGVRRG